MNTENNKEVLNSDIDALIFEDNAEILGEEQNVFDGIIDEDDDPEIEMDEDDIDKQTLEFLKLRGKRKE